RAYFLPNATGSLRNSLFRFWLIASLHWLMGLPEDSAGDGWPSQALVPSLLGLGERALGELVAGPVDLLAQVGPLLLDAGQQGGQLVADVVQESPVLLVAREQLVLLGLLGQELAQVPGDEVLAGQGQVAQVVTELEAAAEADAERPLHLELGGRHAGPRDFQAG